MLMVGEPGCGKTMIAQRIPTILPEMTEEECLEVTKIYSISGLLPNGHLLLIMNRQGLSQIIIQSDCRSV